MGVGASIVCTNPSTLTHPSTHPLNHTPTMSMVHGSRRLVSTAQEGRKSDNPQASVKTSTNNWSSAIATAVSENIMDDWMFNRSQNDRYIPLGHMRLRRKKNKQLQKCTRRPSAVLRLVHATLSRRTPCPRASRHRFGPVQASLALCSCEPRPPPGLKSKPCRWKKTSTNNWSSYVEEKGE